MKLTNSIFFSLVLLLANSTVSIATPKLNFGYGSALSDTAVVSIGSEVSTQINDSTAVSFRPELTIKDSKFGVNGGVTLDKDFGVNKIYSGFGFGTNIFTNDQKVTPFVLLGADSKLYQNVYLRSQLKVPFSNYSGTYSPVLTAGLAYSL